MTPHLLITLGTSWPIVPEACLFPHTTFGFVHVLTTGGIKDDALSQVKQWFESRQPQVDLRISRVRGFDDLKSQEDHMLFEEVLYRWILETETKPEQRYFCLSGGYKTMSAAMQKAAAVLGAGEVFHVLADPRVWSDGEKPREPGSAEEIDIAHAAGRIRWVRLGSEEGWPQLRHASRDHFPLDSKHQTNGVRIIAPASGSFRERLHEIVNRAHRISGAWESLPDLPFNELATWSSQTLAWLKEPLVPNDEDDKKWVKALPKIELHCHLGGFATHGNDLEQVRLASKNPELLPPLTDLREHKGWRTPPEPIGLEAYRQLGDNNGSSLLVDQGCLQAQCRMLYEHFLAHNVLYAEVRCSPANYANAAAGRSPWTVLQDIRHQFNECMTEARNRADTSFCHVNLIIIGTRQETGDFRAGISRHLSLAVTAAEHWTDPDGCRVVGVDLAGFEDKTTRAQYFREEFTAVHRCGLALTVHAGEVDDAEGIWSAVFELNARRLGHGLSLVDSPDLLRSIADRGIAVEMCPYANFQIRGYRIDTTDKSKALYPLKEYLNCGVRVTVNTDNIGISAASLTDNLLFAASLNPGLTRLELLQLQRNALEAAFLSPAERGKLLKRITKQLHAPHA